MFQHLQSRLTEESISNEEENPEEELKEVKENVHMNDLKEIEFFLERQATDLSCLNKYLLAMIKKILNKKEEAIVLFIEALKEIPLFWTAWIELLALIVEVREEPFDLINLIPENWVKNLFIFHILVENAKMSEQIEQLGYDLGCSLLCFFPNWTYLHNSLAMLFYVLSDYDNSIEFFYQVLAKDPFRLNNMDVLSNILYVKEKHNELGKLAIRCFEIDKYSPETCCVLGNYYSLIDEHSKAAAQFQRSVSLDPNFLSGYTLLGMHQ
jgi:anaphase-promoting complex subunit 8